jgi:adenylosuccinate synthase
MSAMIVVDALWGDSGKGKIASYLAERHGAALCVRAGTGTNAGHSMYLEDGALIKTNQIPLAGITSGAQLRVGSGVAVDPRLFAEELQRYDPGYGVSTRTKVDLRCPIILPEYLEQERGDSHLSDTVGSTCSGTGIAQAQFVLRRARQARELPQLAPYVTDVAREVNEACSRGATVVVEGSQGTFLSLALSRDYPCCTSGNCTTAALADDVGLSWRHIGEVVLVVKALPSRVGEGPLPFEMSREEQDLRGIAEFGVRTGRRRRKASGIDWDLLAESAMLNGPTQVALTFCDHFDPAITDSHTLTPAVERLIAEVERTVGAPVTLVETGKSCAAIIDR